MSGQLEADRPILAPVLLAPPAASVKENIPDREVSSPLDHRPDAGVGE